MGEEGRGVEGVVLLDYRLGHRMKGGESDVSSVDYFWVGFRFGLFVLYCGLFGRCRGHLISSKQLGWLRIEMHMAFRHIRGKLALDWDFNHRISTL